MLTIITNYHSVSIPIRQEETSFFTKGILANMGNGFPKYCAQVIHKTADSVWGGCACSPPSGVSTPIAVVLNGG